MQASSPPGRRAMSRVLPPASAPSSRARPAATAARLAEPDVAQLERMLELAERNLPWSRAWRSWPAARYMLRRQWLPPSPIPANMPLTRFRHVLHVAIEDAGSSRVGFFLMLISSVLTIISVVAFSTQTLRKYRMNRELGISTPTDEFMDSAQLLCVTYFTVDYLLRLLTVTACPPLHLLEVMVKKDYAAAQWNAFNGAKGAAWALSLCASNAWALARFVVDPLNVLDLISIVPVYLTLGNAPSVPGGSMLILRVLRLGRVLTAFKTSASVQGVTVMLRTLIASMGALISMLVVVLLIVVLMGSAMYFCESGVWDPSLQVWLRKNLVGNAYEQTPFASIPHAMWYVLVTVTTVGYGDFYPTSDQGRVLGACCILIGVVVIAMPIAVVGERYTAEYKRMTEQIAAHVEEERAERERDLRQHVFEYARSNPELFTKAVAPTASEVRAAGSVQAAATANARRWKQALAKIAKSQEMPSESGSQVVVGEVDEPLPPPAAAAAAPDVAEVSARLTSLEGKIEAVLAVLSRLEQRAMEPGGEEMAAAGAFR
jgi:hypothetical protein